MGTYTGQKVERMQQLEEAMEPLAQISLHPQDIRTRVSRMKLDPYRNIILNFDKHPSRDNLEAMEMDSCIAVVELSRAELLACTESFPADDWSIDSNATPSERKPRYLFASTTAAPETLHSRYSTYISPTVPHILSSISHNKSSHPILLRPIKFPYPENQTQETHQTLPPLQCPPP